MDVKTIEDCARLSLEGRLGSGENVKRLLAAGVVRHCVDLVQLKKTSYGSDDAHTEGVALDNPGKVGSRFSEAAIAGTTAAIQKREIDYKEFLRRLIGGGCVYYVIFMKGRKMEYFGSLGESRVEDSPEKLVKYLEGHEAG